MVYMVTECKVYEGNDISSKNSQMENEIANIFTSGDY